MDIKAAAPVDDVVVNIIANGSPSTLTLKSVLHVPLFKLTLLSVSQMDSRGLVVEVKQGQWKTKSEQK